LGQGSDARGRPYEILVEGCFPAASIQVDYTATPAALTPELRRVAAGEWPGRVARAAREGVALTNGHLLRLAEFRSVGGELRLVLGDTTYSQFLASNCDPACHTRVTWSALANPLGTSALIVTRDGKLVLGLRGHAVMHSRDQVHTIGGMFEAADLVSGQVDAAGSILREVHEELGVQRDRIASLVCRGLMRELEHLQPELMFDVVVDVAFSELRALWEGAESRAEHADLIAIPDDLAPVSAFIEAHPGMAAQALAALQLRAALLRAR